MSIPPPPHRNKIEMRETAHPPFHRLLNHPDLVGRRYLPDEFPAVDFSYTRGTVAMANSGAPDSGGSQFFIVLADIGLPPNYTVFGRVVDGFDTLERIAALPMAPNPPDPAPSRPLETIYLETVEIVGD